MSLRDAGKTTESEREKWGMMGSTLNVCSLRMRGHPDLLVQDVI